MCGVSSNIGCPSGAVPATVGSCALPSAPIPNPSSFAGDCNAMIKHSFISLLIGGLALGPTATFAAEGDFPIAGTAPYQRPAGAPVIAHVSHDPAWFAFALTGVSQPYPDSLVFLRNQGNWYTPFDRPGMLPPYDLRGWHQ